MREIKPTQKDVPSSDVKDLFFNSGLLDIWATSLERKYIDRFGNCHLTAAGMEWIFNELVTKFKIEHEQALLAAGYAPAGTFQEGAEVVSRNGTVLWKLPDGDGDHYRWDGDLPKQVPAGSTPQSTGGVGKGAWVSVGEASAKSWTAENFEVAKYIKTQSASFESGSVIEKRNQVLKYAVDGFYYEYIGNDPLPIIVPENSNPNSSWRCVGDASYPLTVDAYGGDSLGKLDSSSAFQLMFDNFGGISLKSNGKYLIDNPVRLYGSYPIIEGNKATIYKTGTMKSGLPLIQTYMGYAEGDVNCFFIGSSRVSYPLINNLALDARQAPIEDRPAGFYFTQLTDYEISGINTLGCKHSIWIKSSWVGNIRNFRGNESTSDDFFYDSSRLDANGIEISPAQSATSVTMSGVYSNTPSGRGFRLERVDYSNLVMTACDKPASEPYYFDTCKTVVGSIAAENFKGKMIIGRDSFLNLAVTTYGDGNPVDDDIFDLDNVTGELHGNLRITNTKLAKATNRTKCTLSLTYWNGVTAVLPEVTTDETSEVIVKAMVKNSESEYDDIIYKYGIRINTGLTPFSGSAPPPRRGAFTLPVFKNHEVNGDSNLFLIPRTYLKSVIPSFEAKKGTVLSITIDHANGYCYGASFRNRDGVLMTGLENQITVGNANSKIVRITMYQIYLSIETAGNISEAIISIKEA